MKIEPINEPGGGRKGILKDITVEKIVEVLGFQSNCKDDPYKVVNSWGFTVDGVKCGIWDYKGSHKYGQFSVCGPSAIFEKLFGEHFVKERF